MKIVLLLFMTFNICFAYSQTVYMKVSKTDGTCQYFPIQDVKKLTFSDLTSIQNPEQMTAVIKNFNLLKSYPNPFTTSTTIEYDIPEKGYVKILVYDISGKLVQVLFSGEQTSGKHQVVWDGSSTAGKPMLGGIYNCTVHFQNKVLSNKLLFIK